EKPSPTGPSFNVFRPRTLEDRHQQFRRALRVADLKPFVFYLRHLWKCEPG
ncbi:hypothetical protein KXV97_006665, partial [Aspergillus fumigatus]